MWQSGLTRGDKNKPSVLARSAVNANNTREKNRVISMLHIGIDPSSKTWQGRSVINGTGSCIVVI